MFICTWRSCRLSDEDNCMGATSSNLHIGCGLIGVRELDVSNLPVYGIRCMTSCYDPVLVLNHEIA